MPPLPIPSPKPIRVVRVTHGYNMFVNDAPVVRLPQGFAFDVQKANIKSSLVPWHSWDVAPGARPFLFKRKEDVKDLSRQILHFIGLKPRLHSYLEWIGMPSVD
jgi:hypothetical protein